DTPDRLKATAIPGTLVEVEPVPGDVMRALETLSRQPGVRDVALYGTAIHAVLARDADGRGLTADDVRAILERAGVVIESLVPIHPTLEDVFIALTGTPASAG